MLLYNVYLGIRRSIDDVYDVNGAGWRTGSAVEAVKGKLTPRRQGKWEWDFFYFFLKTHIRALWPFQRLYSTVVVISKLSTLTFYLPCTTASKRKKAATFSHYKQDGARWSKYSRTFKYTASLLSPCLCSYYICNV